MISEKKPLRTWQVNDQSIDFDPEATFSTFYARDCLELITGMLWDMYPRLRPMIKAASDACWRVWEDRYKDTLPHMPCSTQRYWDALQFYFGIGTSSRGIPTWKISELFRDLFDGSLLEGVTT